MHLSFSTESLEPEARFEAFRDTLVRRLFQLELINRSDGPYFGVANLYLGGAAAFGQVHGGMAEFFRSPQLARRCEEGAAVLLTRSGQMYAEQGDIQCMLGPGEGIIFDDVRARAGRCMVQSDTWVVQVPDVLLRTLRPRAGGNATTRLPRDAHLTRMMMGVLEAHHRLGGMVSPEVAASTAQYLADLVALALGTDDANVAEGRGLRAARLQAVLDDICHHYLDIDVSAASVAQRIGVTPRYVHQLLEDTGKTFSDHVLDHRLTLARRLIQEPQANVRKIADVAFSCGFNDLSYFNRTFRRRFGMTPSDLRAGAAAALRHREPESGTSGARRRR